MLRAVEWIHSAGVVHRNIKARPQRICGPAPHVIFLGAPLPFYAVRSADVAVVLSC